MQLYDILSCSNKFKTVDDLYNQLDLIIDLAKDDVQKIAKSRKIYFFDFDTIYFQASKALKRQLLKTHLTGIKRFWNCENIEFATNWLVSRLLNNCTNLATNKSYSNYMGYEIFKNAVAEGVLSSTDLSVEDMLMTREINKLPREAIKGGLKKVYSDVLFNVNFDLLDFEELCMKFNFDAIEVIGYDPRHAPSTKVELTASGNSQLTLFFEFTCEKENKK